MPLSLGPASDFGLLPETFQKVVQEPELQGRYNILVAELMDNQGLGEHIWPFFADASRLLDPQTAAAVIPRRLTLYAVLVAVELKPAAGVELWPMDPFFFWSSLPTVGGIGDQDAFSLDMDALEDHWRPVSRVEEVMTIDLA